MSDTRHYFLCGPESAAIVTEAMDGFNAYHRRVLDALAPLGIKSYHHRDRHFVAAQRVGPAPPGWRVAPRRDFPARRHGNTMIVPDRKHPGGKAFLDAIGWPPNWPRVEDALGIERRWDLVDASVETGIRYRQSSYGAEIIGKDVIIVVGDDEGQPFGGAPTGCTPLARSAYYAMREADTAKGSPR